MHWGKGQIVEEALYRGQHHEPCIQLLEYEDGSLSIRFCYYTHSGRFQRSPMMIGDDERAGLRDALRSSPRLRSLLGTMVP
jgi:hypothetical protein